MTRPTDEELIARLLNLDAHPESAPKQAADRIAALLRACKGRDELVALLKEARADLETYIESDWPAATRATYPSVASKYRRDMALCKRIDEALAAIEETGHE